MVVEVRFDLFCQFQPGFVLCVGVGVHEDGGSCMAGVALHRLEVAIRLQELVGGTGVPQTVDFVNRGAGSSASWTGPASHRAHTARRGSWQGYHRTSQCRRCAAPALSASRYRPHGGGNGKLPGLVLRSWHG